MCRAQDSSIGVDNGNQDIKRQAAQLRIRSFMVSGVTRMWPAPGIVLNALENLEVCIFLSFRFFQ